MLNVWATCWNPRASGQHRPVIRKIGPKRTGYICASQHVIQYKEIHLHPSPHQHWRHFKVSGLTSFLKAKGFTARKVLLSISAQELTTADGLKAFISKASLSSPSWLQVLVQV